jgi:uncharacterized membrane protein
MEGHMMTGREAPEREQAGTSRPEPDNARITSLSDGVFAFATTLMIVTIDVPDRDVVPPDKMPRAVLEQWPHFASYVLTFFVIVNYWVAHHRMFRHIRTHDGPLIWLNILFLLCISFLPFPTDLAGEYESSRFAQVFYAASMTVTSLVMGVLWWYASRRRHLLHERVSAADIREMNWRSILFPLVFLLSIGVSFVHAAAAKYTWLLLPLVSLGLAWAFRPRRAAALTR